MDPVRLSEHRRSNRFHALVLLGGMGLLLATLGWLLAGTAGAIMTLVASSGLLLLTPQLPPELILRMYSARAIHPAEAPELHALLHELARRADLQATPILYYVPSRIINAFALGHGNRRVIAVTDGLLRSLGLRELVGVLAHEISHIRHNDMWVMVVADIITRLTSGLALVGLFVLVLSIPFAIVGHVAVPIVAVLLMAAAPTLSTLLQLGLSRNREFDADLGAVGLTGDPRGLASALDKLERYQGGWLEQIFLPGRHSPDPSLLRSHPPTPERIRRLLALEPRRPFAELIVPDQGTELPWPPVTRPPRWRGFGTWY
jgi:heat shock protein HtpX